MLALGVVVRWHLLTILQRVVGYAFGAPGRGDDLPPRLLGLPADPARDAADVPVRDDLYPLSVYRDGPAGGRDPALYQSIQLLRGRPRHLPLGHCRRRALPGCVGSFGLALARGGSRGNCSRSPCKPLAEVCENCLNCAVARNLLTSPSRPGQRATVSRVLNGRPDLGGDARRRLTPRRHRLRRPTHLRVRRARMVG